MASTYKTPGVYIEEIPKFPPSVAAVETAIPVFVGYTEKVTQLIANDLIKKPVRISSFLEFQDFFGNPPVQDLAITLDSLGNPIIGEAPTPSQFNLYYAVRSFYDNGGGPSYIISLGAYPAAGTGTLTDYDDSAANSALNLIKKIDEVTLLVFPDLSSLGEPEYYTILKKSLSQAGSLKDRFVVMDVLAGDVDKFRNNIGTNDLKYGAAYYPHLKTIYNYNNASSKVVFKHKDKGGKSRELDNQVYSNVLGLVKGTEIKGQIDEALIDVTKDNKAERIALILRKIDELLQYPLLVTAPPAAVTAAAALPDGIRTAFDNVVTDINAVENPDTSVDPIAAKITILSGKINDYLDTLHKSVKDAAPSVANSADAKVESIGKPATTRAANTLLFAEKIKDSFIENVKSTIKKINVIIPPSAAIAGVYAYVDNTRGVWKAPANVSLNAVIEPVTPLNDADQSDLNVHDTGKSINAIRTFTGRGVMVWGSRTLAGNDNEWRYVNVRRFFNFVEESVKKATVPFVFEPNDANTWVRVKGMIENFLILQWRAGALAGAKPEDAFYVAVGINKTMTALDILEGRLIVEIGMAVVRPAEFIILRFSHKMQES